MAVGVSVSQPPVSLVNTANAVSQKHFRPVLVDAIFKPSPSWWRLTRLGRKIQGGSAIVVPVVYAEEAPGGAYWGANVLDTSLSDSIQPAEWQWRHYHQPIVIPYTDLLFNSGPTGVIDLVKAKEEIAMASLLQKISRALYRTAPQNTTMDLDSLELAVNDSTSVYGGVDRSVAANSFWVPGAGNGPKNLGANLDLTSMQVEYGRITFGNEEPDTILTTQAAFNAFWGLLVGNIRYVTDEETTRAGFKRHLVFNNAVVLHDQFIPAKEMYFLNTKYICVYFHEDDYFVIDSFLKPSNQRVLISNIFVTLQLVVKNPRMQQALVNISNG
jgi:hypothetical protein